MQFEIVSVQVVFLGLCVRLLARARRSLGKEGLNRQEKDSTQRLRTMLASKVPGRTSERHR